MPAPASCDLAIVGGGLAGGLIALALARRRPGLDIAIIEAGAAIGGNHLWSVFDGDVAEPDRWIVAALVGHRWQGYDVRFPGHSRTLPTGYASIESAALDRAVRAALPPERVRTGARVLAASPTAVVLADGERIAARGVIDARGASDLGLLECGWQKFVGREIRLPAPHGLVRPLVMDAAVAQADGYRFLYCLPFAPARVFVEDTYYSDSPALNVAALGRRIDAYAGARGWHDGRTVREEAGVLPVVMGGDFDAYWQSGGNRVAKAGVRAGLFHPLTSYSLPDAVRTAALVANAPDLSGAALHDLLHDHARRMWRERGYYRMLARMLFQAARPAERWRVFERFYRLDPALIERFYAARATFADRARVLAGKPPVPVGAALKAIGGFA